MIRSGPQMVDIGVGIQGTILAMDAPLQLQCVSFSGNSTITVNCSGTYKLTFFGNFAFSVDTRLTFYVKANGTTLSETVIVKDVTGTDLDSFERSVLVHLCAQTNLIGVVDNATTANGGNAGTLTIPANGVHLQIVRIGS